MTDTPITNGSDLRARAYHEAGHCVAAILLRQPIRYVTITPGRCNEQLMLGRMVRRIPRGARTIEQRTAERKAELVIYYAGPFCEFDATGRVPEPSTTASDAKGAEDAISDLFPTATPEWLPGIRKHFQSVTGKLLRLGYAPLAVRYVANALIERRRLTGREVKLLVHQAEDDSRTGS